MHHKATRATTFDLDLEGEPAEDIARLLSSIGLPAAPIEPVESWSSRVWLTPRHVVRISSGRFRNAFAHERRVLSLLPDTVPHASVAAHGTYAGHEWMVLERLPGEPLMQTWAGLAERQRRQAVSQVATILRAVHQIQLPEHFCNPWLQEALTAGGQRRNAYHAPAEHYRLLIDAAHGLEGVENDVLDAAARFIAGRLDAFDGDRHVLVHADLHFANLLWDGNRISGVLDFEGARPAPADLELDTLLRFSRSPELFALPNHHEDSLTAANLGDVPIWLEHDYPVLFAHPRLRDRLAVYDALWQLVQLQHFPPPDVRQRPYERLLELLATEPAH